MRMSMGILASAGATMPKRTFGAWSLVSGARSGTVRDIQYLGDRIVISGGGVYYSLDNGASTIASQNGQVNSCLFNGTQWVFLTNGGEVKWTSNFSGYSSIITSATALYKIAKVGAFYLAIGAGGFIAKSATGTGGYVTKTGAMAGRLFDIADNGQGRIAIIGTNGIQTSDDDGETWTFRASSLPGWSTDNAQGGAGIEYVDGVWYASATDSRVQTSSNGADWSVLAAIGNFQPDHAFILNHLTITDGVMVAVGARFIASPFETLGAAVFSQDGGATWEDAFLSPGADNASRAYSAQYIDGYMYVGCENGRLYRATLS